MSLRAIAWQSRSSCMSDLHSYEIASSFLLAMTWFLFRRFKRPRLFAPEIANNVSVGALILYYSSVGA
jgi:hypothetical protein